MLIDLPQPPLITGPYAAHGICRVPYSRTRGITVPHCGLPHLLGGNVALCWAAQNVFVGRVSKPVGETTGTPKTSDSSGNSTLVLRHLHLQ